MGEIVVTQVPPATVSGLQRLARSHQRSLQAELRVILERAALMTLPEGGTDVLTLETVKTGYAGSWPRAEIYGADGR